MTRTVQPNRPARALWLLAGLIDRATSHWFRTFPLDGGDDEDADTGTDTTAPDDDNGDIASFTSQLQPSRPQTCDRCARPSRGYGLSDEPARAGIRRAPLQLTFKQRGVQFLLNLRIIYALSQPKPVNLHFRSSTRRRSGPTQ